MSDGMITYDERKTTEATEYVWEYDDYAELSAVKCKNSDGKELYEVFFGRGLYGKEDPGFDKELLEKYGKKAGFGTK